MKYILGYILCILISTPIFAKKNSSFFDADIFFSEDIYTDVQLSPNGQFIAFLKNEDGVKNLYVNGDLHDIKQSRKIENNNQFSISNFQWSSDSKSILYISEKDGWYNINTLADIGHEREYDYLIYTQISSLPEIVHLSSKDPALAYVLFKAKDSYIKKLYQVNLNNGGFNSSPYYFLGVEAYYFDNDDDLRLITKWSENHQDKYTIAVLPNYELDTLITTHSFENTEILSWNEDNSKLIFGSNTLSENLYSLYSYDFKTKKTTLIQQDPEGKSDLYKAYLDPTTADILGSVFYQDKATTYWENKTWEAAYDSMKIHFPQSNILVESASNNEQYFIFKISSDTIFSDYYLYDTATQKAEFLCSQNPSLKSISSQLSNTNSISYKSKDGRDISGYITLPNQKKKTKLPLIVLVHEEIYEGRVYKEHQPLVQLLANRGFAVFQPNFRGSAGFGKEFLQAGFLQWGKAIQEDIHAGVRQLIDQKIAHAKKIVIMGSGHGGYEALMSLVHAPDLYAGAIDIDGLLDLNNYVKAVPKYWEYIIEKRIKTVGNPYTISGIATLQEQSPLHHTGEIKQPLLMVQSINNPNTTLNETLHFAKEVEAHKKKKKRDKVSYLLIEDEHSGDQLALYNAVEHFLFNTLRIRHQSSTDATVKNRIKAWEVNLDSIHFFDATDFKADSLILSRPWMRGNEYKFDIQYAYDNKTYDITLTRSYDKEDKNRWKIHDNTQAGQLELFYYNKNFQPMHREVNTGNEKEEWTYADGKIYFKTKHGDRTINAPNSFIANGIGMDYIIGRLPLTEDFKMQTYLIDEYSNQLKPCTIEVIGTEDINYYKHYIVKVTNLLDPENYIKFWMDEKSKLMSKSIHQIPSLGHLIITSTKH